MTKRPLKKAQKGTVTGSEQGKGSKLARALGIGVPVAGAIGIAVKALKDRKKRKQEETKAAKATDVKRKGGAKKLLRKAQYGDTIIGTPSLKDVGVKNVYQGPLNKSDYENLNKLYPVNNETPRLESTVLAPRVLQKDKTVMGPKTKMYESAGNQYMKNRTENYLRSGNKLDVDYDGTPYPVKEKELYSIEGKKKGGAKKPMMKKGGSVKKMKTGGMVNSNTKVSALKSAGSKGVKSGVNTKASASKRATGRTGGTSTAPKGALPKAKYGMVMRRK